VRRWSIPIGRKEKHEARRKKDGMREHIIIIVIVIDVMTMASG